MSVKFNGIEINYTKDDEGNLKELNNNQFMERAETHLNPVFHSKTIDFRLKSITIDGASVNARLTDIIAEYET